MSRSFMLILLKICNAYKYFMKEMPAADDLRITGDFVDGVTDIKKFIKKKN